MTCIAALVDSEGEVWMGGDAAATNGTSSEARRQPKVWRIETDIMPWVFGYTWSFRMGQLLQFKFEPPTMTQADENDPFAYMCTKFVDSVRDLFKDNGYSKIDSNVEQGGNFLVGVKGRIFEIESDFQVGESLNPYAAVGCGSDLALGAMYALRGGMLTPSNAEWTIKEALGAASEHNGGVRGPFSVVTTLDKSTRIPYSWTHERDGADQPG